MKTCNYCEKPCTAHSLDTDEKWCLDHWQEWQKENNKKLEDFKELTGIKAYTIKETFKDPFTDETKAGDQEEIPNTCTSCEG